MKSINKLVGRFSDLRIPLSSLPPTFLLPSRARYFNSTAQIVDSPTEGLNISQDPPVSKIVGASPSSLAGIAPTATASTSISQSSLEAQPPKPFSDSIKTLLPLLRAQPSHYVTAHIHARPYLLTPGDTVRLPFHMPGVTSGDVLRLTRASAIGSRDYTLKGTPYVDERLFECRAVVMGTEGEPVRVKEKTKRRDRKVKTVRSKHKFTILKLKELTVNALEDIEAA